MSSDVEMRRKRASAQRKALRRLALENKERYDELYELAKRELGISGETE